MFSIKRLRTFLLMAYSEHLTIFEVHFSDLHTRNIIIENNLFTTLQKIIVCNLQTQIELYIWSKKPST